MSFRNSTTGQYPVSHEQIRKENPNTSFPAYFEQATGYDWVVSAFPEYDPATQTLTEIEPTLVNGVWTQTWSIVNKTAEEIAEIQAIKQESKANRIRNTRNRLLAASDWTQLADSSANKESWATYRQALRDITLQSTFPDSVTWPTHEGALQPNVGIELP